MDSLARPVPPSRLPTVLAALAVAVLAVATWYVIARVPFSIEHSVPLIVATGVLWVLFAVAFMALKRVPVRHAVVIMLAGSLAMGAGAMTVPPGTSSDSYRYAWDGIVQNAGISPYKYVPTADALEDLRPEWLFPRAIPNADGTHHCADPDAHTTSTVPGGTVICTFINRSKVVTIYPPAAELFFAGIRLIVGPDATTWVLQLVGLLLSLGVSVMLLLAMRRRGIDPRWAALWALCPFVTVEAVNNAHVDMLGALFVLLASLLVARGIRWRGGIALGVAIAVKLVPAIAAPALLRKQPWKVVIAAVVTFGVLYIPYVVTTGVAVIGYLPGYLSEEGYSDGQRLTLLSIFVPPSWAIPIAVALLAVTAVIVWRKTDPSSPWLGQVVMIGTALLILSPRYSWYALLLIPFIAMTGRWEWFAVALALTLRVLVPQHLVYQVSLSVAVVGIVAVSIVRTTPARRARLRHPFTRDRQVQ